MAMILVTAGPADLLQPGMVGEFDTFTKDELLFLIGVLSGNLKEFVDSSQDPERWRAEFAKRVYGVEE